MEDTLYDFTVVGGDMRQVYLAEELAHHQNHVCHYALCSAPKECHCSDASVVNAADSLEEALNSAPCVICPVPFCKAGGSAVNITTIHENISPDVLVDLLTPGQYFFAGCIPEDLQAKAKERGVRVYDLMEDLPLAYYNSIATAEGAICEAILRSPKNLHKSHCAVLGCGKCGSTLLQYLKGMFCQVYAASDSVEERARASIIADRTGNLREFRQHAGTFDFIFNTVPAPVLPSHILHQMKDTVTIIDIASSPGGVDFQAAQEFGINAVLCPGLPGKYAPASSAEAIRKVIESAAASGRQ